MAGNTDTHVHGHPWQSIIMCLHWLVQRGCKTVRRVVSAPAPEAALGPYGVVFFSQLVLQGRDKIGVAALEQLLPPPLGGVPARGQDARPGCQARCARWRSSGAHPHTRQEVSRATAAAELFIYDRTFNVHVLHSNSRGVHDVVHDCLDLN